jgi:cobalt-zinc-cadmium efflux system outer membrane protein
MNCLIPVSGILTVSVVLAGCASIPADRGVSVANELLLTRSGSEQSVQLNAKQRDVQAEVDELLALPMHVNEAVRLALLNSPRMRVLYAELGFAQADVYDASRLSNPSLGYLRTAAPGGASKTTWSLSQSFTELLFLHYRTQLSRGELLQAQQRIAHEVLALEADVRSAYYQYVSAELISRMTENQMRLAEATSQYAQQLFDAGNISKLQLNYEQAQGSEVLIRKRKVTLDAQVAHAKLMTLLGLSVHDTDGQKLPRFEVRLPLPVALTVDVSNLQAWAQAQRLDLAALSGHVNMLEENARHVSRWHWLGGARVLAEHERDSGSAAFTGVGAEVDLPLFNQGAGNVLRADASLEMGKARIAQLQLEIRNDVAVRYAAAQAALANVEEYRTRLLPMREQIVTLNQRQHDYMLIGTFELLTARRQEMDAYQLYLEAVRDYWIAHSELLRAAGGYLPEGMDDGDTGISIGAEMLVTDHTGEDSVIHSEPVMEHVEHPVSEQSSSSGVAP